MTKFTIDGDPYTLLVHKKFIRGDRQLMLIKEYTDDNRVELVSFDNLMEHAIYTALFVNYDEKMKADFPPDSIIWFSKKDNDVIWFQEATRLDQQAEDNYKDAVQKMHHFDDMICRDGQNRKNSYNWIN